MTSTSTRFAIPGYCSPAIAGQPLGSREQMSTYRSILTRVGEPRVCEREGIPRGLLRRTTCQR